MEQLWILRRNVTRELGRKLEAIQASKSPLSTNEEIREKKCKEDRVTIVEVLLMKQRMRLMSKCLFRNTKMMRAALKIPSRCPITEHLAFSNFIQLFSRR